MYSNVHGTIGAVINTTVFAITRDYAFSMYIGNLINIPLHYVVDMLGEKSYGNLERTLLYEVYGFALFFSLALNTNVFWLFTTGWVSANALDLYDKKFYLAIFFPDDFKATYKFHRKNQVKYTFTLNQTIWATMGASILMIVLTIISKWAW